VVGDGEAEVVVEDGKSRLVHAQSLLELVEHDLKTDDHAPQGARQLGWSDVSSTQKILREPQ
jgi:hypothetical protein